MSGPGPGEVVLRCDRCGEQMVVPYGNTVAAHGSCRPPSRWSTEELAAGEAAGNELAAVELRRRIRAADERAQVEHERGLDLDDAVFRAERYGEPIPGELVGEVVPGDPPAPAPCECQPCADRRRRKARRTPPENGDYAAMLTRQIAAYGRRVGEGDPEDLTTALGVLEALEEAIAGAVMALRAQGWSWAAIGRCAADSDNPDGLTRQGAEQRWGREFPRRPSSER